MRISVWQTWKISIKRFTTYLLRNKHFPGNQVNIRLSHWSLRVQNDTGTCWTIIHVYARSRSLTSKRSSSEKSSTGLVAAFRYMLASKRLRSVSEPHFHIWWLRKVFGRSRCITLRPVSSEISSADLVASLWISVLSTSELREHIDLTHSGTVMAYIQ